MTLTRSAWRPVVAALAAAPGALALGLWIEPWPVPVAPIVSPVTVIVSPTPAPTVVIEPPPPPPLPVSAESPPRPPTLRVLTPSVDAACLLGGDAVAAGCAWERGFPAISGDGRTIATEVYLGEFDPDGEPVESPGVAIHFLDAGSLKLERSLTLLAAGERDRTKDPHELRARVTRRAAGAQRSLATRRYRSMELLDIHGQEGEVQEAPGSVFAEAAGDAIRIIDGSRSAVIWQRRLAFPTVADPGDSLCVAPFHHKFQAVWWDAASQTVMIEQSYATGGCMCDTGSVTHVHRIR
jgi:hypothetical protein